MFWKLKVCHVSEINIYVYIILHLLTILHFMINVICVKLVMLKNFSPSPHALEEPDPGECWEENLKLGWV